MEDITEADYAHAKRIPKYFEIKILEEYHDLHVQSNTFLSADYLRTLELCALKYANLILQFFFQLPDFTKVKLGLLTDSDILLMVEKDIKGGICHSIYEYAKANNKLMKDYDKMKNRHIFNVGV